jgi:hypothetical protein
MFVVAAIATSCWGVKRYHEHEFYAEQESLIEIKNLIGPTYASYVRVVTTPCGSVFPCWLQFIEQPPYSDRVTTIWLSHEFSASVGDMDSLIKCLQRFRYLKEVIIGGGGNDPDEYTPFGPRPNWVNDDLIRASMPSVVVHVRID